MADPADRERFIELANDWLARGAELVPVQPRSKHLVAGFGPRQATIITPAGVRAWLGERACNFGVVLGRFCCFDFDDWQTYGDWRHGPGHDVDTVIERTARGAHVFFELPSQIPSRAGPGWEFKTSGVVLCAPSVHPNGGQYAQLTDYPIPLLEEKHKPNSFPLSVPLLGRPSSNVAIPAARDRDTCTSSETAIAAGAGLIARIKAAVPLTDLLTIQLSGEVRWRSGRCPFHLDRKAHLWADTERQLWGCLSTRCPQHGTHDVINLYAALNGCDVRAAIRALAKDYKLNGLG